MHPTPPLAGGPPRRDPDTRPVLPRGRARDGGGKAAPAGLEFDLATALDRMTKDSSHARPGPETDSRPGEVRSVPPKPKAAPRPSARVPPNTRRVDPAKDDLRVNEGLNAPGRRRYE